MNGLLNIVNSLVQLGLCDHCLGRQLGKLTTGTTNDKRGRALRLFSRMAEEYYGSENSTAELKSPGVDEFDGASNTDPISPVSGSSPVNEVKHGNGSGTDDEELGSAGKCPLCCGLFTETDTFADLVVDAFSKYEFDTYLVGNVIDEEIIEKENEIQKEYGIASYGEGIKSEMNRVIGLKVYDRIGKDVSFGKPDIVGVVDTRFDSVSVQISPIFLYGRYRKFDRTLPQTIWNCKRCRGRGCEYCDGTGKIYQTSVQELIGDVVINEIGGSRHLFHAMGREDIDARMLGTGRPFILEISNPSKRNFDPDRLTELVNSVAPERVKISGLSRTVRENVSRIKNMKADKSYLAEVEFDEDVTEDQLKGIEESFTGTVISQRTPTRVAHRRSDLVRERKVINMNCRLVDDRHAAFTIKGESGLYIKELIHGNEGRTQPSVSGNLKTGCTVLSLDVMAVHYENDLDQITSIRGE